MNFKSEMASQEDKKNQTLNAKEQELIARIEKRFAPHQGDEIMTALKVVTQRRLIRKFRKSSE